MLNEPQIMHQQVWISMYHLCILNYLLVFHSVWYFLELGELVILGASLCVLVIPLPLWLIWIHYAVFSHVFILLNRNLCCGWYRCDQAFKWWMFGKYFSILPESDIPYLKFSGYFWCKTTIHFVISCGVSCILHSVRYYRR